MARCTISGKGPSAGKHVSHSQVRARRMFQPNIQKVNGVRMSTRVLRTLKNKGYLVIG